MKSLENQAKKAEKYFEIKKEYRELSIELAKAALEGFNLDYRELNAATEAETDKKLRLEAEIAGEEAALEQEKLKFIEQERALQSRQHEFNDLVQHLQGKENEKSLAQQRLNFLREKGDSLQEFLQKGESQLKGLEESIVFTRQQVLEEENKLSGLQEQLESHSVSLEETRRVFDEKRVSVDALRGENARIQREQFDAEKKVAVADTSIQNLQRSIRQLEEERTVRDSQLKQLEEERHPEGTGAGSRGRRISVSCRNRRKGQRKIYCRPRSSWNS